MKILNKLPNKNSQPVEDWSEVKDDARDMMELIDSGDFVGDFDDAAAISHVQVSEDPKRLFVVHKELEDEFDSRVIINPKILEGDIYVKHREGCMSYPTRGTRKIRRYKWVKAKYEIPEFKLTKLGSRLKTVEKNLYDLPSFVLQHELDHMNNQTLWN